MTPRPGTRGTAEHTVTDADTATAIGSGDVEVYATPAVVALCERAAVSALAGALDAGQTSVGTAIAIDHVAPTLAGRTVTAEAVLESVEGRTLRFTVSARDPAGPIATGTHTRVIVDRERFLSSANDRA